MNMSSIRTIKKRHLVCIAAICILSVVALAISADAADRLRVKDNDGNVQFVVTDTGTVGIGTANPTSSLDISRTSANATIYTRRSDGATTLMNATSYAGVFGTINNFAVRLLVNNEWKMKLNLDNSISTATGAYLTSGGVWQDASSRDYKENIRELKASDANEALNGLNPVVYNYKAAKAEKHVGFIAEDVPDLVATQDRKSLSPMDIVAVLTKVVKEQKQSLAEQDALIKNLSAQLAELSSKVTKMERMSISEQK
jgi:hypothetical protein